MGKLSITILFNICIVAIGHAQIGWQEFSKYFNAFKDITTLTYNSSFKTYGKNAGKGVEAEGRIAIQKSKFQIEKYKTLSISEIKIMEKVNFEDIIYDGFNVYPYNHQTSQYENKGSWADKGKNYIGYSSILYNNIVLTYHEFEKNKNAIVYQAENNGCSFRLPADSSRGEVIMYFNSNNFIPDKILQYNEKENVTDFVSLTLHAVRGNCNFPITFFDIPKNTDVLQSNRDNHKTNDLSNSSFSNSGLLSIGTMAPAWELINSDGKKRSSNDYKGKVIIMDFWATWCAPCINAQPKLQSIHENYKNVVVLGMDYNDYKGIDLNAYKKKKKLSYEMLLKSESISEVYQVRALPTVYVIDKFGKIIYAALGYSEAEEKLLLSVIDNASK
jgi:thiol-disulfide isomerase/thioredoxin